MEFWDNDKDRDESERDELLRLRPIGYIFFRCLDKKLWLDLSFSLRNLFVSRTFFLTLALDIVLMG